MMFYDENIDTLKLKLEIMENLPAILTIKIILR